MAESTHSEDTNTNKCLHIGRRQRQRNCIAKRNCITTVEGCVIEDDFYSLLIGIQQGYTCIDLRQGKYDQAWRLKKNKLTT
ncbi:CLUMA_CG013066, isoform A [Clunio marinus]|uniref:CLUMA_CG013066, isoform A n=1 Tax=Clunio marinus TaxID=568069 RepID=A0A1J1IHG5_9DIPT|nr:CLUMA_CG013066, isoform A [Clunio marinus]